MTGPVNKTVDGSAEESASALLGLGFVLCNASNSLIIDLRQNNCQQNGLMDT